jgi:hypothetical protein
MIEWVQVKGFNEEFVNDNGQLDLWSESRYQVFRKITENANAAMLHFYSPTLPDLAVRSFMVNRVSSAVGFIYINKNLFPFRLGSTALTLSSLIPAGDAAITFYVRCHPLGETSEP